MSGFGCAAYVPWLSWLLLGYGWVVRRSVLALVLLMGVGSVWVFGPLLVAAPGFILPLVYDIGDSFWVSFKWLGLIVTLVVVCIYTWGSV